MTFELNQTQLGETTFIDTPGFFDVTMKKQAAEAISKALKQNAWYRVVFVVTLESGRVRPQDVAFLNIVLESAPEIDRYGVIFNKLSDNVIGKMELDPEIKYKLISEVSLGTNKGKSRPIPIPLFLSRISILDDNDNVTTRIQKLEDFIGVVPLIEIHKENVTEIEIGNYERYTEQVEGQLTLMNGGSSSGDMLRRVMENDRKEFEKRMVELITEERRKHEQEIARLKEELALSKEKEERLQQEEDRFERKNEQYYGQIKYMTREHDGYGVIDLLVKAVKTGIELYMKSTDSSSSFFEHFLNL